MKKAFLPLLMISVLAVSCSKKSCCTESSGKSCCKEKEKTAAAADSAPITKIPIVGGDSDAHGCKGSAGYTWSELKKECIRTFESGIRLDAQAANLDKALSAFVVFKNGNQDSEAEIFVPSQSASIILKKSGKEWKNDAYILSYDNSKYSILDAKRTLLYKGGN